jgi:hypothetical protein
VAAEGKSAEDVRARVRLLRGGFSGDELRDGAHDEPDTMSGSLLALLLAFAPSVSSSAAAASAARGGGTECDTRLRIRRGSCGALGFAFGAAVEAALAVA